MVRPVFSAVGTALCALLCASLFPATAAPAPRRTLTFEERVRAQERIERVYYAHQIGATQPFEEAVPRSLLESRVSRSLRQSVALERYWKDGLTSADLRAETERVLRSTRFPRRLKELFAALDNDTFLFQECVARASLGERRLRMLYRDGRLTVPVVRAAPVQAGAHRAIETGSLESSDARPVTRLRRGNPTRIVRDASYEDWWAGVEPQLDPHALQPVAEGFELTLSVERDEESARAGLSGSGCTADTWNAAGVGGGPDDGRYAHTSLWTGSLMLVWGGRNDSESLGNGYRYDPVTDGWTPIAATGAPVPRFGHVAFWTGSLMLVWGSGSDGGRYDPVSDSWSPITLSGAPSPTATYKGIWTGSQMIVWAAPGTAGRYDPAFNTWSSVSSAGAPSVRTDFTAVWTGARMVIWGGSTGGSDTNTGALYDPVSDTWAATAITNAPVPRHGHTAVWTGSKMIVWGGKLGTSNFYTQAGGRYDPASGQWQSTSLNNSPGGRYLHSAVWTGTEMIIVGGKAIQTASDGGRYRPDLDTWTHVYINEPWGNGTWGSFHRDQHTAVWDGSQMIVYGGRDFYGGTMRDGGRYSPPTDTWTHIGGSNLAPSSRSGASVVWTGNEMIIWGGSSSGSATNTGTRYDPLLDRWTGTTLVSTPVPRSGHSAVWTGSKMIVWGGVDSQGNALSSGSLYDPLWNAWSGMSTGSSARMSHTAVWTGSRMVVWGGVANGTLLASGGRYDPVADAWAATSETDAPSARTGHSAVWNGSRMFVWGGWNGTELAGGAAYDPVGDAWSPITDTGAPEARQAHAAVWTGHEMVVWGGFSGPVPPGPFNKDTGGRYDPALDSWTPTSLIGAPSPRSGAGAVWTGTEWVIWSEGSGSRYRPSNDSWTVMTTSHAPQIPGPGNSALVWSGDFVIVWGSVARTGSRYSIDSDLDGSANTCDPDDDDDGVADALDCGPEDPSNTAMHPPEVSHVTAAGAAVTHIQWDAQSGVWYDVVRGVVNDLSTSIAGVRVGIRNATCVASGLTLNQWDDASPRPPAGKGWLYLVRAKNSTCDERAYGPPTFGLPLIPLNDCP